MRNLSLARWLLVRGGALTLVGMLILAAIPFGPASGFAQSDDATPAPDATPTTPANAELLSVEGALIALSPDGNLIAGHDDDHQPCVWDMATLTPQCTADPERPPIDRIDYASLTWAPESDALAFSLDAAGFGIDSDIFVIEVNPESGAVGEPQNLTDDGYEGTIASYREAEPLPVDVMPAWTPDGTELVFARALAGETVEDSAPAVYRIARAGGEPEHVFDIEGGALYSVYTPMYVSEDGSIFYTLYVGRTDDDDMRSRILKYTPEGNTIDLFENVAPDSHTEVHPVLMSVSPDGSQAMLIDHYRLAVLDPGPNQAYFSTLIVDEGVLEPVTFPDASELMWAVSVAPDGERQLSIVSDEHGFMVHDTADPAGAPLLRIDEILNFSALQFRAADWSDQDTVLIPLGSGDAWLLDVAE